MEQKNNEAQGGKVAGAGDEVTKLVNDTTNWEEVERDRPTFTRPLMNLLKDAPGKIEGYYIGVFTCKGFTQFGKKDLQIFALVYDKDKNNFFLIPEKGEIHLLTKLQKPGCIFRLTWNGLKKSKSGGNYFDSTLKIQKDGHAPAEVMEEDAVSRWSDLEPVNFTDEEISEFRIKWKVK